MNQKYLQGISSDMDGTEDAVFFEATPENITAFLMQHQWAAMSAISTVDDRSFLTARTGLIDVCPDQEFLAQKLLPVYAGVQMDRAPIPPLKTVSKEIALAEKCPLPDWNYLRWNGYSDEKYQALRSGKGLLELSWQGETVSLELQVRSYYSGGNLALLLVDWSSGEVEKNGLGKPTGRAERSGFVTYPECQFQADKLRELDAEGYQIYCQLLEQNSQEKLQKQKKKDLEER